MIGINKQGYIAPKYLPQNTYISSDLCWRVQTSLLHVVVAVGLICARLGR